MPRNWFNRTLPLPKISRSMQDLHEDRLQTMRMSRLVPFGIQECLPKDLHMFSHDAFLRLAPLKYPILQKMNLNMASFFVPDRLVLGEDKQAELVSSLEPSDKLIPKLQLMSDNDYDIAQIFFAPNSIADYLGIECQPLSTGNFTIPNPLPFFEWLLILKNYYLDENLEQDKIAIIDDALEAYQSVDLGGTAIAYGTENDDPIGLAIRTFLASGFHVSKYRDYFVAGLPTAQKGDDVYIMNPVNIIGRDFDDTTYLQAYNSPDGNVNLIGQGSGTPLGFDTTVRDLFTKMAYERFKTQLQQFGTRYNEFLAGNFGVINQDVRLQRPECICRSRGVFNISEVIQQSASQADSPLGSYAGKGLSAKRTRNTRYYCNEHGFLFHLCSVVPDQGYASGAPRWFYKESGLDFALPQFNNVGEQPIWKGELFIDHETPSNNKKEFAYIPRYSEYRTGRNYASAGMRQSPFTAWHLYEAYDASVALNEEFIRAVDSDRIFNLVDPTSVQNIVGVFHSYHAAFRPISNNPK